MEFREFAEKAEKVEELSGDYDKTDEVARLFDESETDCDLEISARFIQGRVFASWDDTKLDVGRSLLYDSLSLATGVTADEVEEKVKDMGDVGLAAESFDYGGQMTLGTTDLTLEYVHRRLSDLAEASGGGSQKKKVRTLSDLFNDATPKEAKYIARLVAGEMRVGVSEGTVRDAVAEAFDVDVDEVERGLMVTNDAGEVAVRARDGELSGLRMEVGRPVKPMLAQAGSVEDLIEEAGEVAVETKYDGARLQIHRNRDTKDAEYKYGYSLFSRKLEDVTESLPDVVEILEESIQVDESLILDSEVVAVEDGEPLAFQEVLRRFRRKYDVDRMTDEVELQVNVFDILYRENQGELIDLPLRQRYSHLDEVVPCNSADHTVTDDLEEVRRVEKKALDDGQEGIMVKKPGSTYSPGKRGKDWIKVKPEPETLDLIVVGGEWGEGRRADEIGSYLLAAKDGSDLRTVGKVATGLTDADLGRLTQRFEPLIIHENGKEIEFRPEVVFEVGYEEIQTSPKYTSGYALRFPRFLGVREDKSVDDADTVERIERLREN
ncbi:MAG: ATP-dependent DNA ligase [Halobacteria archaeon]|nr:ATP-dependent DNA ligase [Halobacteria archaeon]